MKSDKQWCKDNGVPETARWSNSYHPQDVIKMINAMLKIHKLRIRTKHRRGHGPSSYIWVESNEKAS